MKKQLRGHRQIRFLMEISLIQALFVSLCISVAQAGEFTGADIVKLNTTSAFLLTNSDANAIIVSGKITDNETGEPVPGVNILVKGTTIGTTTDADGKYSLSVPDENAVLIISFIGYTSEEIAVGNQTDINVSLTPDIVTLIETVVVGYGTQKKADVIGSISTVNTNDLNIKSVANFDAGLQGLAAGVSVQTSGGQPGAPTKILIRGTGSISSSTDPLFVLDGMPIYNYNPTGRNGLGLSNFNPMATINQNDIESIQVLKDAAATSIYGSRGSNGVIIITTKKGGKPGESNTTFNYSTGITSLTRTPDDVGYANSKEWFKIMDKAYLNTPSAVPFDITSYYETAPTATPGLTLREAKRTNTDWFKQVFDKGYYSNYNLSSSRGFDKGSFFVSGNYRKDQGVQKNTDLERFSIRSNVEFNPSNNVTLGARLTFSTTKSKQVPTGLSTINSFALPWFPINRTDQPDLYFNAYSSNPTATNDPKNFLNTINQYRGLGGVSLNVKIPFIKGLSVTSEASADLIQSNVVRWTSKDINTQPLYKSSGSEEAITYQSINYNAYANFDRSYNQHTIGFTAGVEATRSSQYRRFLSGSDLTGNVQELGSPRQISTVIGKKELERYLLGFFARANYKFKERYLFGLSGRRDGTTAFTKANRWANFYAASAGWILSEEDFMSFLNGKTFLKLRGSYGETGNQNVPQGLNVVNYNSVYVYGNEQAPGTLPQNIAVSNLKWESTKSADVGIDFGIFNNRINGSVAYYHRFVTDMLLKVPVPVSAGVGSVITNGQTETIRGDLAAAGDDENSNVVWNNVGDMVNSGLELELHSINIDRNGFKWTTDFNISFNKNTIKTLSASLDNGKGLVGQTTVSRTGHKRREWFVADWAGVDSQTGVGKIYKRDEAIYSSTGKTVREKNSDGEYILIDANRANTDNNKFVQDGKSSDPTYYGGITNTLKYKGFDFSFLIAFSGGNYILDTDRTRATLPRPNHVLLSELLDESWQKPGDEKKYPKIEYNESFTGNIFINRELYKGDYVRLRNVQLGYTLPNTITQKIKMQGVRVYVSATNLFTKTSYPGYDPEGAGPFNNGPSDGGTGLVYYSNAIPQLRSYNFGLDIKF